MSKTLHFSDDLSLPVDAATQTFAFIARKGAGKTYAAGKLAELLIGARVQVVVIDTVGNWYGLRIAADGKGAGLDIPVIGGLRGDVPLAAESGHLIADLVVDTGRSLVIDASQFSLGDRKRFATAFGEQLWKRKKGQADPTPVHLILEECQLIIPQFVGRDDARMVGIFEEIVRLGRNYGIGVSMITQRPQSVNKEVLTQTEALVVGQVNGVPERKALKEWIVQQGEDVKLADELPSLHVGTMFFWSPQWLRILQKIKVAKKTTFDASSTPKVGEVRRSSAELKPINLDELKAKMSATIEKAKADDPRELRRQIGELQKAMSAKPAAAAKVETKTVEKPVITDKQIERLEKISARATERVTAFSGKIAELVNPLMALLHDEQREAQLLSAAAKACKNQGTLAATFHVNTRDASGRKQPLDGKTASAVGALLSTAADRIRRAYEPPRRSPSAQVSGEAEDWFRPAHQRILNAIAWLAAMGMDSPARGIVAAVAGVSPKSSSFLNDLGRLSTMELARYPSPGRVAAGPMLFPAGVR